MKYYAFPLKHKNLKKKLLEIEAKFLNSHIADKDQFSVQLPMIVVLFTINTLFPDKNYLNAQLQVLLTVFLAQMDNFFLLLSKTQHSLCGIWIHTSLNRSNVKEKIYK